MMQLMRLMRSMRSILDLVVRQRVLLSMALWVGLSLVLLFHAPVVPVLVGCLLAILYMAIRAAARSRDSS